jgi:ankyrin repeat protein
MKSTLFFVFLSLFSIQSVKADPTQEALEALKTGNEDAFIALLNNGLDFNSPQKSLYYQWSLFHEALAWGRTKAVRAMLDKGVKNINDQKNRMKYAPIYVIAKFVSPREVMADPARFDREYVIFSERWANDPARDEKLANLVKERATRYSTNPEDYPDPVAIGKWLIEAGADVNVRSSYGASPLHASVEMRNTGLAEALIAAGADVNARRAMVKAANTQFPTPLYIAISKDHPEMIRLLISKGVDTKAKVKQYINDANELKKYGYTDRDLDKVTMAKVTHTPLTWANFLKREKAQAVLIELGVK